MTFATSTSSASLVRGTGIRWPESSPPARTKHTWSLTIGAPTRLGDGAEVLDALQVDLVRAAQ